LLAFPTTISTLLQAGHRRRRCGDSSEAAVAIGVAGIWHGRQDPQDIVLAEDAVQEEDLGDKEDRSTELLCHVSG
jgi:hypothetical protein